MRLIYTTCPYPEEARSIAKKLVEEKVVACANYWVIKSLHIFEDTFKERDETALLLRVAVSRLNEARTRLREMHSYSVPAIIVLKPEAVNNHYMQWVHECCGSPEEKKETQDQSS